MYNKGGIITTPTIVTVGDKLIVDGLVVKEYSSFNKILTAFFNLHDATYVPGELACKAAKNIFGSSMNGNNLNLIAIDD